MLLSALFFFTDPATTQIYTLSLHDALPISTMPALRMISSCLTRPCRVRCSGSQDRKSTRLNSSHRTISYAVFCLKKKKKYQTTMIQHFTPLFLSPLAAFPVLRPVTFDTIPP